MSKTTGLQVAQLGLVCLLETWRGQLGAREFAVLVELLARWLERERATTAGEDRRQAA